LSAREFWNGLAGGGKEIRTASPTGRGDAVQNSTLSIPQAANRLETDLLRPERDHGFECTLQSNLNLVSSPTVAAAYAAHWRNRLAVSVQFERRGDWCPVSSPEVRLGGCAAMSERQPPYRQAESFRVRRVTVRVPEDYAEAVWRTRQRGEPSLGSSPQWRRLSPSAELLVDPECQVRGIIRDTRARGADRFHWSVFAPDQSHTVAAGHTGRIARGRWLAETALRAFVEDWREQSGRQGGHG
jgi:hypothetical protein